MTHITTQTSTSISKQHQNKDQANSHINTESAIIVQSFEVYLRKNKFYHQIQDAYSNNASDNELKEILGRARAKIGMFEGDLDEGELEIGQISSAISDIKPAHLIVEEIMQEFHLTISHLQKY